MSLFSFQLIFPASLPKLSTHLTGYSKIEKGKKTGKDAGLQETEEQHNLKQVWIAVPRHSRRNQSLPCGRVDKGRVKKWKLCSLKKNIKNEIAKAQSEGAMGKDGHTSSTYTQLACAQSGPPGGLLPTPQQDVWFTLTAANNSCALCLKGIRLGVQSFNSGFVSGLVPG